MAELSQNIAPEIIYYLSVIYNYAVNASLCPQPVYGHFHNLKRYGGALRRVPVIGGGRADRERKNRLISLVNVYQSIVAVLQIARFNTAYIE